MKTSGILAVLLAALVLSVSLSSAACDVSCAFSQLVSNCDHATQLADQMPMQMAMPMQMEGMEHAHYSHQSKPGQELATIQASSNMGSCPHQPCDKPAVLSLQKIRPMAHQLEHAVLTVVAHLPRNNTFLMMHHLDGGSFSLNLPALDPLSTRLRV